MRLGRRLVPLAVMLAGSLAAIATLGPRILDTDDLGWLLHGTLGPDPVAYLVAWTYFLRSPWLLPPGLNPDYGLDLSSAIFYVDAVPLGAFIAKALEPVAEIGQFWGPWMALCGALQAGLAWRLLSEHVRDPLARGLGAVLFAFQPMMLNRMGGHFQLVGQWLLLWALWLCLRRDAKRQGLQWVACLGIASMVNAYLLAMAGLLWAADWLGRMLREGFGWRRFAQVACVLPVVAGGLWAAGYFVLQGEVEAVGLRYGETQLDLTAPFDAMEWGRLLPALPGLRHWEHGGSYLGAGTLLLLAAAALLLRRGDVQGALRRHAAPAAMLTAMLAYAITNRPAFAGHVVTLFELPDALQRLADMLRSSERFFWPLAYALIAAAIAVLAARLSRMRLRLLLGAVLVLQIVDVEAGMASFRALVAEAPPVAEERLRDPVWERLAERYARLRAVPFVNEGPHWEELSRFAVSHGMPTDAIYLSRVDPAQAAAHNARLLADLGAGRWELDTLYVLRDAATEQRVAMHADPMRDLLAERDGMIVFAPGFLAPAGPPIAMTASVRRAHAQLRGCLGAWRPGPARCPPRG